MTLGQVAYERWRALHDHPLVSWDKLPKKARSVWEEIAKAVAFVERR